MVEGASCLPSPSRHRHRQTRQQTHRAQSQSPSSSHNSNNKLPQEEEEEEEEQARYAAPTPTPSTPSSTTPSHQSGMSGRRLNNNHTNYHVDAAGEGTSTKSCFNIFSSSHNKLLAGGGKHHNSSKNGSSDDAKLQHPTPSLFSAPVVHQQDDFAKTWEAFYQNNSTNSAQRQQPQQGPGEADGWNLPPLPTEEERNSNSINPALSLLQLPRPVDRSHKRRLHLEQEKRKSGVYEGEMEPEGVRGQEATVVYDLNGDLKQHQQGDDADSSEIVMPLRQFTESGAQQSTQQESSSSSPVITGAATANTSPRFLSRPSKQHLETIAEVTDDSVQSWSQASSSHKLQHSSSHAAASGVSIQQQDTWSLQDGLQEDEHAMVPSKSHGSQHSSASTGSSTTRRTPSPGQHLSQLQPRHHQEEQAMLAQRLRQRKQQQKQPRIHNQQKQQQPMDPPAAVSPSFDSDSTSSDDDIGQMMSDFLQQDSTVSRQDVRTLVEREYPNPINVPQSPIDNKIVKDMQHQRPVAPMTVSESCSSNSGIGTPNRNQQQQQLQHQYPARRPQNVMISPSTSSTVSSLSPARRSHFSSASDKTEDTNQLRQQHLNQHHYHDERAGSSNSSSPALVPTSQQPHARIASLQRPAQAQRAEEAMSSRESPEQHQQLPIHAQEHLSLKQPNRDRANPQSVDAWNALALQHVHNGEYDMALAAFQHVLRAYKLEYGNVHPLVASAHHNLGTVHAKRAQLLLDDTLHQRHCRAQSLQCFQSAARAARDSLGRDHPNVAVSLVRIGFLLLQARQYNNAVITFQEALRIRQAHYGPHHALVANLYNNLGVCYMHLGQFAHGRDLLQHALTIQRTLLNQAETSESDFAAARGEEKKDHHSSTGGHGGGGTASQALELADTLFNIGGLALEWIRRQGPDVRHAEDAEAAFEEALELRKSVLGPKDPMVLQVKSLLDMARSIPRPKSSGRRTAVGNVKPCRGNGNVNFQPQNHASRSELPDPVGVPPDGGVFAEAVAQKGERPGSISPPRRRTPSGHQIRNNSPHNIRSTSSKEANAGEQTSPSRYSSSRNNSADDNATLPQGGSSRNPHNSLWQPLTAQALEKHSPGRLSKDADYLARPRLNRRSLLDEGELGDTPVKPRHTVSPTMNSQVGRHSIASSTAETVKMGMPHLSHNPPQSNPTLQRQHRQGEQHKELQGGTQQRGQGVFRQNRLSSNDSDRKRNQPSPMVDVTLSKDEEDNGLYNVAALPGRTNIFISPHYVPHMSPHKVNHVGSAGDTASRSISTYSGAPISPVADSPFEVQNSSALFQQLSYDAEESCLLSDWASSSPADAIPDDYGALRGTSPSAGEAKGSSARKIMVARPYRSAPDDSITSPTSVISSRAFGVAKSGIDPERATTASIDTPYRSETDYSSKTSSWSEANQSERSATLSRARALLQANKDYIDSPQVQLSGRPPYLGSPENVKQQLFHSKGQGSGASCDQDMEDGLAPLGASDGAVPSSLSNKRNFSLSMLTRPQDNLNEIFKEASRCMKNHKHKEAVEYFSTILLSQQRRHGPFHQDVAAALHNCGLGHLRAGNHHQALKAFEESARIRKGTLGKEHPAVAVSLVKCGITFLLLHRFEDALWSFREALSIRRHALGTQHPSTARVYNNIGCVHVEFNELSEARGAFEGALDIQRNALCHDPESGPIRFGTAATLCNLGYLYRYCGMHEKAAQVLREAVDLQEAILGSTHRTVCSTLDSLAEALMNSAKNEEAYDTYLSILVRFRSIEREGSLRLLRAEAGLKYKMSIAAKQMHKRESQIKNLQQALQAVRSLVEPTDSAQLHASALENRILSDLRETREAMEASELNWV